MVAVELSLREAEDKTPAIQGYAARYNSRSELIHGSFRELIAPGAFDRSLKEGTINVRALFNHNEDNLLGTLTSGTLTLASDDKGLGVQIDPPNTQYARDMMECIRRGDIRGMSFAFTTVTDEWRMVDGVPHRTLLDVDLHDVSVVTNPAYPDTSVKLRGLEELLARESSIPLAIMRMRLLLASTF